MSFFAGTQVAFKISKSPTLADKISEILNDENLPKELYLALANAIGEHSLPQNVQDAPDYIQKVIDSMNDESKETENEQNSNCLDLAEHFASVLADERTPENIHNVLSDELSSIGKGNPLSKITASKEYIAARLCEELEK